MDDASLSRSISLLAGVMQRSPKAVAGSRDALIASLSEQLVRMPGATGTSPEGAAPLPPSMTPCQTPRPRKTGCNDDHCGLQIDGHCSFVRPPTG
ncbi:hypothetical protein [Paroceanicella profunda]|uniref:hypothetical protein n=1 Tax=Paroceanicella profunda TaxID=2579971 RepID=UPI00110B4CD3|nr:hypothetical protein [Paroceanicella profunda]